MATHTVEVHAGSTRPRPGTARRPAEGLLGAGRMREVPGQDRARLRIRLVSSVIWL